MSNMNAKAPGKCYGKMKYPNGEIEWIEVICGDKKRYFQRAQMELVRLGYEIEQAEINKKEIGQTTKSALRAFQEKNKFATGLLDEATLWKLINS